MKTNNNIATLHINSAWWDGEFQKSVEFFIRDSLIMGTPFMVDSDLPESLRHELIIMAMDEANKLSNKHKVLWFNIHNYEDFIEFTPRRIEIH